MSIQVNAPQPSPTPQSRKLMGAAIAVGVAVTGVLGYALVTGKTVVPQASKVASGRLAAATANPTAQSTGSIAPQIEVTIQDPFEPLVLEDGKLHVRDKLVTLVAGPATPKATANANGASDEYKVTKVTGSTATVIFNTQTKTVKVGDILGSITVTGISGKCTSITVKGATPADVCEGEDYSGG